MDVGHSGKGSALVFYPFPFCGPQWCVLGGCSRNATRAELAATVVRVGRVGAAPTGWHTLRRIRCDTSRWAATAIPLESCGATVGAMRAIGRAGYGQTTKRSCPSSPRGSQSARLSSSSRATRSRWFQRDCGALRGGARVFATDACYNQEHLKFVLDASGDLVPMLFDPWHTSSMQVVVAPDCHDMPWKAPSGSRPFSVSGCADVTMDVCLSDDADGEVLDRKGQGPASAPAVDVGQDDQCEFV